MEELDSLGQLPRVLYESFQKLSKVANRGFKSQHLKKLHQIIFVHRDALKTCLDQLDLGFYFHFFSGFLIFRDNKDTPTGICDGI